MMPLQVASPEMGFAIMLVGLLFALSAITYQLTPNPVALFGFALSITVTAFWFIGFVSVIIVLGTYVLHGLAMAGLSIIAWWS